MSSSPQFFTETAIQVNGFGTGAQFLNVATQALLPQNDPAGLVTLQTDASLFNVPYGSPSSFYSGLSVVGSSAGPEGNSSDVYFGFIDNLSFAQPLLFALEDEIKAQPFTGQLFCNVETSGKRPGNLKCQTDGSAPFVSGKWAICEIDNYSKNKLYLYDPHASNGTAPSYCTPVTLTVLAVNGAT